MWIGLSWKNYVWTWEGGPRSSYLNWADGHPGDFTPIEGKFLFKLCVSIDTLFLKNLQIIVYLLVEYCSCSSLTFIFLTLVTRPMCFYF